MLFNIESDTGAEITGYLVPDGYSEVPRLCAIGSGRLLWSGEAGERREALVASGRHETGLCGFRIGPSEVPDLAAHADAEIRCLASGLTLYRRPRPGRDATARIVRIETRLRPLARLDQALERHFQAWYPGLHAHGNETVTQIFLLHGVGSLYASGRLMLPAHPHLADGGLAVAIELRNPFEELAERLLLLSGAFGPVERLLPLRDRMALDAPAEALAGLAARGPAALARAVRRMPAEAAAALSNPLTRQLTCAAPQDLCAPGAVASALRALSAMDVVALADLEGHLEGALAALAGCPAPLPERSGAALAGIADALAAVPIAEAMLECDLEVYASAAAVFETLATGTTGG